MKKSILAAITVIICLLALNIAVINIVAKKPTVTSTIASTSQITDTQHQLGQNQNVSNANIQNELKLKRKTVYLTFDDGPNKKWTPTILSILAANHVKATFFVVGTAIEKNPELLEREKREGHAFGNHSYDHIYREIYASPQAYIDSLKKNDALLKSKNITTFVTRPPGGHRLDPETKKWLRENHMKSILWNLWTGDGDKIAHDSQFLVDTTQSGLSNLEDRDMNQVVVLMHDGLAGVPRNSKIYKDMSITREADLEALPIIIRMFKQNGYTFEVLK